MKVKETKLHIRELSSRQIVHSFTVTGKSERAIEKIMLGLLRTMDTDKFYIDDSETS